MLYYRTHITLIHTPGYQRARHAASTTLIRQRRKRHSALTLRHKTPLLGGLGDYCTRDFRRVRAPIRQRDCTDRPPRRPPWQLSIAPAAAPPGTQQRYVSRRAASGTCDVAMLSIVVDLLQRRSFRRSRTETRAGRSAHTSKDVLTAAHLFEARRALPLHSCQGPQRRGSERTSGMK